MSVVRLQIGPLLKACLEVVHGRDAACRAIWGRSPCKEIMLRSRGVKRDYQGTCTTRAWKTNRPCLFPRALQRFSPHKRMEAARSCTFCTPAPSVESHLTSNLFFHQSFIPQLRDRQTGGRGINSLLGQDHKLIVILFVAENERDEKAVPDVCAGMTRS